MNSKMNSHFQPKTHSSYVYFLFSLQSVQASSCFFLVPSISMIFQFFFCNNKIRFLSPKEQTEKVIRRRHQTVAPLDFVALQLTNCIGLAALYFTLLSCDQIRARGTT